MMWLGFLFHVSPEVNFILRKELVNEFAFTWRILINLHRE